MKLSNGKEYKMNPDFKKIWIKALLSGKYIQCKGHTGYGSRRCALGVAAAEKLTKVVFGAYVPRKFLHPEAAKIVGLMNDKGRNNFEKIAAWIEENL